MEKPSPHAPAHPFTAGWISPRLADEPAAWVPWPEASAELRLTEFRRASVLWQHAVHDVRGKLGVVMNLTTLLQRPVSEPRRSALLAMLDRNVTSLGRLLDGVADLARLDAVPLAPALARVNAAQVLQDVCSNIMPLAESRGLRIEFRGPALLVAETDAVMLERIAQNLVLNAVRYTRASGVMLTCGAHDGEVPGHWFFDLRDQAPPTVAAHGPHTLQHVQATAAAPPMQAGEGIGLAIVAQLTHLLGGDVESAPTATGRWTRVRLPKRAGMVLASVLEPMALVSQAPVAHAGAHALMHAHRLPHTAIGQFAGEAARPAR